jgi:hypothetical protein
MPFFQLLKTSKHVDSSFFIAIDIFHKFHYLFCSSVSCERFGEAQNKASGIIFGGGSNNKPFSIPYAEIQRLFSAKLLKHKTTTKI